MRISKRVSQSAYERTLNQLIDCGVDITMLPDAFYIWHWSERRHYIMHALGLYQCPRCRDIGPQSSKHRTMHLCQECGERTDHHIIYTDDDDRYVAPSITEPPTRPTHKPTASVDDILNRAKGTRNG